MNGDLVIAEIVSGFSIRKFILIVSDMRSFSHGSGILDCPQPITWLAKDMNLKSFILK